MLYKQILFKQTGIIFLLCGVALFSCTNNDTNDRNSSDVITSDTSVMVVADTVGYRNVPLPQDSPTAAVNDANEPGVAKPNPAKKGMKGKVVITTPTKKTGSMEVDKSGVYSNVEYIPMFPGGDKGLQNYFDKNIQYPDDASSEGVEGVVNVSFVVDENGKLTGLSTEGQKLGYGLEEEALRVIKAMPAWTPGRLKGNNVKTRYTLPVRFELY